MDNILVLAPYEKYILKAIDEYQNQKRLKFIIIGDKKVISGECLKLGIVLRHVEMIDISGEVEICLYAKSMMEKNDIKRIVFGDIPQTYFQKIMLADSSDDIGTINIVDIANSDQYVFISSGNRSNHSDFDDKKRAIIQAHSLMSQLNIKKINACLIYPKRRNDSLESKIIKMIINDLDIKNLEILDYHELKDIFKNELYGDDRINLLVMKNYDATKVFIDSVDIFMKCMISHFLVYKDVLAIDALDGDSLDNIKFALKIFDNLSSKRYIDEKYYIL